MRAIVSLCFALLSIVHATTVAQGAAGQSACGRDGNQSDINACSEYRFKQADAKMNSLHLAKLSQLGGPAQRRLRESQRAWVTYRDAACYYESEMKLKQSESHATTGPMVLFSCLKALTKQRTETLEQYRNCTQNGCPE